MNSDLDVWNLLASGSWKKSPEQCWFHNFILYPSILTKLSNPCRIIDYGCGSGELISFLKDLGHSVVGFDPAIEMVRRAQKLNPESHIVNDLKFLDKMKFDVGLLNLVLPCALDPGSICKLVSGFAPRVIVTTPHPCFSLFSDLHTTTRRKWVTEVPIVDERELYLLGLKQIVSWEAGVNTEMFHRSIAGWLKLFRSSGLTLNDLDELLPCADGKAIPLLYQRFTKIPAFMLFDLGV